MPPSSLAARLALAIGLAGSMPPAVLGQSPPRVQPQRPSAAEAEERAAAKADEKTRRESVLKELELRYGESAEARQRFDAEVAELKTDSARLAAALVAAGADAHATEERIQALEQRLETIAGSQAVIELSLEGRRGLIAEVLAALQRMSRRAAPAVLVRSDDILAAVRASILLGAVVPGLREEVEALAGDLQELTRLRGLAVADRASLGSEVERLSREQERLVALVAARREQLGAAEARFGTERARSDALGAEAKSLKELVDRLDAEIGSARQEAAEARRLTEADLQQVRERFAAASTRDPVRLAPRTAFADAKGTFAKPVAGATIREFGTPDGQGGAMRGIVIASRARAIVTSSCEGWVIYAGPFRSFGRVLIINAGGGYYLLLAGLGQINVEMGQFVLSGEPVGQMGGVAASSAALGVVEAASPALYVEFRKDGGPIDPGPWWLRSQGEKVRG